MSTEIKPRKHAELAARYMADDSLKCWCWSGNTKSWFLNISPAWLDECFYYVGHEAPTEPPKRQITVAGITFDAPETEVPIAYSEYWTFSAQSLWRGNWENTEKDFERLSNGFVHTSREAAEKHREALLKLNRQLCGIEDSE